MPVIAVTLTAPLIRVLGRAFGNRGGLRDQLTLMDRDAIIPRA